MPHVGLAHAQVRAGNVDFRGVERVIDPRQHRPLIDSRAVIDRTFRIDRIAAKGEDLAGHFGADVDHFLRFDRSSGDNRRHQAASRRMIGAKQRLTRASRYHCQLVCMPAASTAAMTKNRMSLTGKRTARVIRTESGLKRGREEGRLRGGQIKAGRWDRLPVRSQSRTLHIVKRAIAARQECNLRLRHFAARRRRSATLSRPPRAMPEIAAD